MTKRKLKRSVTTSSDSEDECLLKLANKKKSHCDFVNKYNVSPLNKLCQKSHESCEFCDKTFENRLQFLVHNAKHIIIPLLKCDNSEKHHKTVKTSQKQEIQSQLSNDIPFVNNRIILGGKKPKVNGIRSRIIFEEDDDVIVLSDTDSDAKTISEVKKQEKASKNVLNSFVSDCRVLLDDPMALFNSKNTEIGNGSSEILTSLTSDCNVNLGEMISYNGNDVKTSELSSRILPPEDPKWPNSIHNDELLKPGLYKCEICKVHFPNRYETIKHKAKHLRVRTTIQGYCIVCENHRRRRMSPLCTSCDQRHGRRYYSEPDDVVVEKAQKTFVKTTPKEVLKLCEVCHMFLMRRSHRDMRLFQKKKDETYKYTKVYYITKENISDTGMKYDCDECQHVFSEIKIVQKIKKHFYKNDVNCSLANKIHFEDENQFKPVIRPGKCLSNEDRLSRIKNRMQKIKKINKF